MTKRTGDEPTKIQSIDPNVDTKIFTPEQEAYQTNKVNDPTAQTTPTPDPFSSTATIGDYRIIRKIGEGGMGVVYEAEQQNPHRLVALKVIRGGLHSDDYHVKMFEREIEALARLKHPGIASIYESGRSDDGQIFFAMELVNGVALSDFVEQRRSISGDAAPAINEQLALFAQIGDVVSHAHQRGVIHRDLKPQNVLVTGEADTMTGERFGVKILDFGLARINDPDFRGNTGVSQVGQIKGTLLYMSPEQVRGSSDEIDVRSDVYALGVMLYEMLSGQMPYDLSKPSLPEAMRIICEEPPKLLSKAWTETHGRSGRIDRDVETIALKALEKEPDRRYQSVAAMLEDIERYLNNQPITARPPSAYYQFRKLVSRHRAAFASMAAIFLLLLGFGVVMAAQSVRIANERDKALNAEQIAEERKNEAEKSRNDALLARNDEQKQRMIAEQNLTRAEEEQKRAEDEKAKAQKAQKSEEEQRKISEYNLVEARKQKANADTQTTIAKEQRTLADTRRVDAENQAEEYRKLLYVSQLNLAEQAWDQADVPRVRELLQNQIPTGKPDLRSFEWYYLWRLAHRETLSVSTKGSIVNTDFSPNGETMAFSTLDTDSKPYANVTHIVNTRTGQEVGSVEGKIFLGFLSDDTILTISNKKAEITNFVTKTTDSSNIDLTVATPLLPPDGRFAAVFTSQSTIAVTEPRTGNIISVLNDTREISLQTGLFSFLAPTFAVARDGHTLAGFGGNTVKIWNVDRGGSPDILNISPDSAVNVALSPDGKKIAIRTSNGFVRLWDVAAKKLSGSFGIPLSRSLVKKEQMEFSPDGSLIAALNGRSVAVWKTSTGQLVTEIRGHGGQLADLAFSPDGRTLMTGGGDEIKMWSIPFDDQVIDLGEMQLYGMLSGDGQLLASYGLNGEIVLSDPVSKARLGVLGDKIEPGKPRELSKMRMPMAPPKLSPDGRLLLTSQADFSSLGTMRVNDDLSFSFEGGVFELWDTGTRVKLGTLPGYFSPLSVFSPDGKTIATIEIKNGVRSAVFWNLSNQSEVFRFSGGHATAFSPNGEIIAITTDNGIKFLDAITKQELDLGLDASVRYPIQELGFSPDGDLLAYLEQKNMVIWDMRLKRRIGYLKGHSDIVSNIAFSPDTKRLASIDRGGIVKIWDVRTGSLVATPIDDGLPFPITFSRDGSTLTVNSKQGIRILRAATHEEVQKQRGH